MARASNDYIDWLRDVLAPLGPITARAMFGGHGIYCHGMIFGLVVAETLYLKTSEQTRPFFEAEGLPPFTYEKQGGAAVSLSYFQAPDAIFDDDDALRLWGGRALAAATPAPVKKTAKSPAKRAAKSTDSSGEKAPAKSRAKSPANGAEQRTEQSAKKSVKKTAKKRPENSPEKNGPDNSPATAKPRRPPAPKQER